MKVLFAQKINGISGSERYFINIIPELQKKGVEVEFLSLYTDLQQTKEFESILQSFDVKVRQVSISNWNFFKALFVIKVILKSGGFDIVHAHLIHADVVLAIVKCFLLKFKLISTKHGYDERFIKRHGLFAHKRLYNLYFWLSLWAERYIDKSFTVSHGLSKLYFELGITKYYPKVIWHGISPPEYIEPPITKEVEPYILVLGRLEDFKGHDLLFEAFSQISDKHKKLRLVIAGSGSATFYFKEFAKKKNIEDRVDFLGFTHDVDRLISGCEFLISPSKGEGFGLIIIEAFSHKKPVIAFDVPAFNEIIEDGINGFLIPPFNVNLMAEKIDEMLTNPQLMSNMGEHGYRSFRNYFLLSECSKNTLEFYNSIMRKKTANQSLGLLTVSLHGGGAESVTYRTALGLAKKREVIVYLLRPKVQFIIPNSIEVRRLSSYMGENSILKSLSVLTKAFALSREVKKKNLQFVLSFLNRPNYINVISKMLVGNQKAFISERTYTELEFPHGSFSSFFSRALIKYLYPMADKVLVNAELSGKSLIQKFKVPKQNIKLFYNPLDISIPKNRKDSLASKKFKIVFIGRLDKNKNVMLLLRAITDLNINFDLEIIGTGTEERKLKEYVLQHELTEKVQFSGFVSNPKKNLEQKHLLVLCSEHEGYPNVLIEALSFGLEVAATDCKSGPREILDPLGSPVPCVNSGYEKTELGYLYALNDVKALQEVILCANEERRDVSQSKLINHLISRHAVSNSLKSVEELLEI